MYPVTFPSGKGEGLCENLEYSVIIFISIIDVLAPPFYLYYFSFYIFLVVFVTNGRISGL
jgi:hypothetical protein